jgi:hypothetical protein
MGILTIMAILIGYPLLALAPVALFLYLYSISRRRLILVTAISWLAYVPYEYAMKLRLLCSGECNIRVDLLLIYTPLVGYHWEPWLHSHSIAAKRLERESREKSSLTPVQNRPHGLLALLGRQNVAVRHGSAVFAHNRCPPGHHIAVKTRHGGECVSMAREGKGQAFRCNIPRNTCAAGCDSPDRLSQCNPMKKCRHRTGTRSKKSYYLHRPHEL